MYWSSRKILLAVFLAGAAAASWWLSQFVSGEKPTMAITQSNGPDYVMSNARVTVMNAEGKPRHTLTAELMQHYSKTNTVRLTKPYLVQYDAVPAPIHTWADTAWLDKSKKVIIMTGNVRIVREKSPTYRGAEITATKARILLN